VREVKRAFGALRVSKRDLDLQHRSAVMDGCNSYSPIPRSLESPLPLLEEGSIFHPLAQRTASRRDAR
jgi:hypothetical protein